MDGILLINKPIGMTSRDVVNKLCKKFSTRKMGHTGTLDPFASGLMIVTVGRGTKISNFMEDLGKSYVAELKLGVSTDTQDLDGQVIATKEVPLPLDKEVIQKAMNSFLGDITQIPPMYSAIKVDGEELYKKARRGEVIERKGRRVNIARMELLSLTNEKVIFEVDCSKGTYIRTLGSDIAEKLGYGGHLTMLTRTRVGSFLLKNAKTIDEVTENDILPVNQALSHMPYVIVDGIFEKKVRNGVALSLGTAPLVLVKDKAEEALAVYELGEDGLHHCLRGLL